MSVRLTESGVAFGFGAGDALVAAKVRGVAPGGIPWPVAYEAAGIAVGFFGGKVGVPADVKDTLLISALALAGSRVTRVAMAGKLAQGPKAWGGDHGGDMFVSGDPSAGGGAPRSNIRQLPGRVAGGVGGGWSILPATQEAPGVAG